jgi:hypothetical protein
MPTKSSATKETRKKKARKPKVLKPGRGHFFKEVGRKILLMRQGGQGGGLGASLSCSCIGVGSGCPIAIDTKTGAAYCQNDRDCFLGCTWFLNVTGLPGVWTILE